VEWAARFSGNFWNIICAVCTMDAHVVMKLAGGGFGGSSSQFVAVQRQRGLVEAAPSSSRLAGNVRVISFGKQAANLSSSTVGCSLGRTCIGSKSIGDSARTASFARNHGPPASLWMSFKVQNLLTRIYATNGAEEEASRSKSYDVNEVIDHVVESEAKNMPEMAREAAPSPLPEGEPSPFSPGVDLGSDDTLHTRQETHGGQSDAAGVEQSRESLQGAQGGGAQEVLKSSLGDTDQSVEEAAGSMSGTSSASPSDATSLEGSQELLSETLQSSVVPITEREQATFSAARDTIHSTSGGGRDWRVFSHGVADKKSEAITASNIQLSATDQGTSEEDEAHKQKYGWSESESDEGSLLAEILQADGGRSAADYESRAHIFGRSAELFGARKTENEDSSR
jgi:hypothetical protein